MHAVRCQPQQDITLHHARWQISATLHRADGKARQIKIAAVIHPRHFRRLTADQGTARCLTSRRNAVDNARGLFDIQLARGKIIQKKQRLGPLTDQIVDAHRHQINADRINVAGINRNAQLGANAIGCSHQNGIGIPSAFQIKQRAKPAKPRHCAGALRALCRRFDPFNQRIACINVHARIGIGQPVMSGHHQQIPQAIGVAARIVDPARWRNAATGPVLDLSPQCLTPPAHMLGRAGLGSVAQRLEQGAHNALVGGSSPSGPTKPHLFIF